MAHNDAVLGDLQRRLIDLGLPADVRHAAIALVRDGLSAPADVRFDAIVARTFCKTATRAGEALGSSSISMLLMLFDLFVAAAQDRAVSVSSLCIASGAAPTTALRQIGQLEAKGFVVRRGDEQDRRRCWVDLTPRANALIGSLLEDWSAVLCG